jgi:hypothetical protein
MCHTVAARAHTFVHMGSGMCGAEQKRNLCGKQIIPLGDYTRCRLHHVCAPLALCLACWATIYEKEPLALSGALVAFLSPRGASRKPRARWLLPFWQVILQTSFVFFTPLLKRLLLEHAHSVSKQKLWMRLALLFKFRFPLPTHLLIFSCLFLSTPFEFSRVGREKLITRLLAILAVFSVVLSTQPSNGFLLTHFNCAYEVDNKSTNITTSCSFQKVVFDYKTISKKPVCDWIALQPDFLFMSKHTKLVVIIQTA